MKALYPMAIIAIIALSSCDGIKCIPGTGEIVSAQVDVDLFEAIELNSSVDVDLSYGQNQKVEITGHRNHIDLLEKTVKGERWIIDFKENICSKDLKVSITLPLLKAVEVNGSGDINGLTPFQADEMDLTIDGSGNISLNISADELSIEIDGSGNVNLDGYADELSVSIDGSGDAKAMELEANTVIIDSDGSGDVEVTVKNRIEANLKGSGNVYYEGDPEDRKLDLKGSGEAVKN